jgi:glycine hydroxymethyltransferase
MVPFDDKSPFVTSGIRVGTAAITSRGIKEAHIPQIVEFIDAAIVNWENEEILSATRTAVNEMMGEYPLFETEIKEMIED